MEENQILFSFKRIISEFSEIRNILSNQYRNVMWKKVQKDLKLFATDSDAKLRGI